MTLIEFWLSLVISYLSVIVFYQVLARIEKFEKERKRKQRRREEELERITSYNSNKEETEEETEEERLLLRAINDPLVRGDYPEITLEEIRSLPNDDRQFILEGNR